jgi:hypothetical protein
VEALREFAHLLFQVWSSRVVSTEECGLGWLEWESIIPTHTPTIICSVLGIVTGRITTSLCQRNVLVILLLDSLVENSWRRIFDFDIFVESKFLPHDHQLVHDLVVDLGINICHVTSKWLE